MRLFYICIFFTVFIFSCKFNEDQNTIYTLNNENKAFLIDSTEAEDTKKSNDSIVLTNANNFMQLMYDSNYVSIEILKNHNHSSGYINNFPKTGLMEAHALGHKKMKQRQNIHYTNSDLFLFKYTSDSVATIAYDSLKKHVKRIASFAAKGSLRENDSNYLFVQGFEPKHGAFIMQEQNFIISLVKRCAGNNLKNVKWSTYEKTFIETLGVERRQVEVIFSSCGDAMFTIKRFEM